MKYSLSFAKAGFVLSVAILGMGYGIAANQWGWFPATYARQAYNQAGAIYSTVRDLPPDSDPVVYDRSGVRVIRPDRMQPGATLIASSWKDLDWGPAVRLLGRNGEVLHEWRTSPAEIFPSIVGPFSGFRDFQPPHGFQLLQNGDLLVNGQDMGLARLNACGEVLWRLSTPKTHHSGARGDDGTFWIPARREEKVSFPGLSTSQVNHDIILNVSSDGEILDNISVLDILYENNLQYKIFKSNALGISNGDITHLNDIDILSENMSEEYSYFEAGDLLISLRGINSVIVFDPNENTVKWSASDRFIRQHDPDFLGNGWVGVFDNHWDGTRRGSALGGSRIVGVHTRTDSIRTLFPPSSSDTFYTSTAGRWQKLRNGNLLLTESRAGRVVEVTESGKTVWEYVNQFEKSLVPEVYGAERVGLTEKKISKWPCSLVDSISTSAQK